MQLKNTFAALLAALTTLPAPTSALYAWNETLQVYELGPQYGGKNDTWTEWMDRCGGEDIPEGGYGCASWHSITTSEPTGSRAVYKCHNGWMQLYEECESKNFKEIIPAGDYECVRNQRRKGKKFYPFFVPASKAVCVSRTLVH